MCGFNSSTPKIEAPKAAPPPAPPAPPPEQITPVQTAQETATSADDKKRKGRDSLRIDLTNSSPSSASGLNIPI